jgi:hypothetical protein
LRRRRDKDHHGDAGSIDERILCACVAARNGCAEGHGRADRASGAMAAGVHVDPSAKTLNDQYARFGRCMGEYVKIHDPGHELALVAAYNRKDRKGQATVEKASSVCVGLAAVPDASYKQSLKANP